MSSYDELVEYVKRLERRLAKLERQEESGAGVTDHGGLTGLGDDDHTQYALLTGRSGGQSLNGGTAANDDLTLQGTSDATRTSSYVILQPSGGSVGIGTSTPGRIFHVSGAGTVARMESSESGDHTIFENYSPSVNAGNFSSFSFRSLTSGGTPTNRVFAALSGLFVDKAEGSQKGALLFSTANSGNAAERVRISNDGRMGIAETSPAGLLDVNQSSSTAAIPTLVLDQADLSEEFIEFDGTVAAGNPIDTAALGTYYGKVRVSVNGTFKYLALYNS